MGWRCGRLSAWWTWAFPRSTGVLSGCPKHRRAPLRRGAFLDALDELRHPKRLGDKRPARLAQSRHLEARHEEHLRRGTEGDNAAGQLAPVHERHDHIDEEEVDVPTVLDDAERLHGIVGGKDKVARRA